MEKDINTEVSNTQLPATEEKANLKESLRIQKSQWIKEQIKRQREAEDAVLEQMIEEQRVIDGLNSDINENLDRTRESRKFNQEFQEKINTQIYEMNGITEDKLKGMREYKNAYYQGCAFSSVSAVRSFARLSSYAAFTRFLYSCCLTISLSVFSYTFLFAASCACSTKNLR